MGGAFTEPPYREATSGGSDSRWRPTRDRSIAGVTKGMSASITTAASQSRSTAPIPAATDVCVPAACSGLKTLEHSRPCN